MNGHEHFSPLFAAEVEPDYRELYDQAMRRLLRAHEQMVAMAEETAGLYNAYRALVQQNEMRP